MARLAATALAAACSAIMSTVVAGASGGECVAPTSLGCFRDPYTDPSGKSHRVLTHVAATADPKMTPFRCVALCCKAGYGAGALAGVEAGGDCRCDHGFGPYTIPKSTGCNVTCTGSAGEKCGGVGALSAMSISQCPGDDDAPWQAALAAPAPSLQQCGATGCTSCPKEDTVRACSQPHSVFPAAEHTCCPVRTLTLSR